MPFERSFGRFHFRKGSQVVPRDLKNDSLTNVKQLFSEIHPSLKWSPWDTFLDPFGTTFPSMPSSMAPKVAKRTLSENIKQNYQILGPKLTPK